jgi:hypothetical protein
VTPAVGDLDGDGTLDVASLSREGNLFVWHSSGDACQTAEWPKYQHDLRNTGDYRTDARAPGAVRGLTLDGSTLSFVASGGNGVCGQADSFVVTVDGKAVSTDVRPGRSGITTSLALPGIGPGSVVTVQSADAAGNRSIPVRVLAAGAAAPVPAPRAATAPGRLPSTGGEHATGLAVLSLALVAMVVRRRSAAQSRP